LVIQTYKKVIIKIKTFRIKILCKVVIKKNIRKMKIFQLIFILIVLQQLAQQAIQRNLEVNLIVIKFNIKYNRKQRTLLFNLILINLLKDKEILKEACIKFKKIKKFKKCQFTIQI